MSDESKDIVEGVFKGLADSELISTAFSPMLNQLGELGENLIKTISFATCIGPICSFGAVGNDFVRLKVKRLRAKFVEAVEATPCDDRVSSIPTSFAAPLIENMWRCDEEELSSLYFALLRNAVSRQNCLKCHPGYVAIISQLVSDEVSICDFLRSYGTMEFIREAEVVDLQRHIISDSNGTIKITEQNFELSLLVPEMLVDYLLHLKGLGLVEIEYASPGRRSQSSKTSVAEWHVQLSSFGRRFVSACYLDDV